MLQEYFSEYILFTCCRAHNMSKLFQRALETWSGLLKYKKTHTDCVWARAQPTHPIESLRLLKNVTCNDY